MAEMQEARPSFVLRGLIWLVQQLTPKEGWLSFLLIFVIVMGLSNAVFETEWVDEIGRIWLNGLAAALLATILAKQIKSSRWAWGLLSAGGLLFTTVRVAELIPPFATWRDGSWSEILVAQATIFLERWLAWWEQLQAGGSSTETLPFLFGVGLTIWALSALLAWQTYYTGKPLSALTLISFGVAVAGYFSSSPLHWLLQVVMGGIALLALIRFVTLQMTWKQNGVDYPDNILSDLAVAVTFFAVLFPLLGYASPRLAVPVISRAFANSQGVQVIEGALARAFGGVDVRSGGRGRAAGQMVGVMPRQHLLSGSPELLQSVVMTATVQGEANAIHWRALSYDNYTGRGWEASAENQTNQPANRPIPHPDIIAIAPLTQTVYWLQDQRSTRYSLGRPAQFDQPTRLQWHGRSDLVRVRGDGNVYQVQSLVSVASAEQLAQVTTADIPAAIFGRYTQLPDTIPQRVLDLADSVTANANTPYEKAKALETFLRQYEYTLAVDAPPADQDVVDFFLFDQQVGYCDYYATAMTVMARQVGLPARMAIGFAVAPTVAGTQELRGIDAHSWTEIHFGDYGWIEFEPTGGFALRDNEPSNSRFPEPIVPTPPPIPERTLPLRQIITWIAACLLIVVIIARLVWRSLPLPDTPTRYAQLQQHAARLAIPLTDSQTPLEFLAHFDRRIAMIGETSWLKQRASFDEQIEQIRATAHTLTRDFMRVQYDEMPQQTSISAQQWQRTRRMLWLLQILSRLRQGKHEALHTNV